MADTMTRTMWVVRRSETGEAPYKTILETPNFETARAEFRALCYRDLACDPNVETRDIENRIPNPAYGYYTNQWSFQYPYRRGAKTRLFKSERKM